MFLSLKRRGSAAVSQTIRWIVYIGILAAVVFAIKNIVSNVA